MKKLHKALCNLMKVNRSRNVWPNVPNLGKALTAIPRHPDRYGVWNGISEEAAKQTRDMATLIADSLGAIAKKFNEYLIRISLNTDLWTLDALWWGLRQPMNKSDGQKNENKEEPSEETEKHFGLERHLHDFLFDNWEKTECTFMKRVGTFKAGYERPTDVQN